jgi:hypothetical protein
LAKDALSRELRFETVYLVLLVAAGAILGGVVVVAMGRGGQIATFRRDIPVPAVRFFTPDEVALARLPLAFFGYQVQATGDALAAAAALVDERDAEIAELRRELSRFGGGSMGGGSAGPGAAAPADSVAAADSREADDALGGAEGGEAVADPDAGLTVEPRWRQ